MCGGSILSCFPRNPHGHERALKEEFVVCYRPRFCPEHYLEFRTFVIDKLWVCSTWILPRDGSLLFQNRRDIFISTLLLDLLHLLEHIFGRKRVSANLSSNPKVL